MPDMRLSLPPECRNVQLSLPGHSRKNHSEESSALAYSAGCGSGLVTGGDFSGDLLGCGGATRSGVGETGSSSGTTVYRRIGSPIWPMIFLAIARAGRPGGGEPTHSKGCKFPGCRLRDALYKHVSQTPLHPRSPTS